MTDQKKEYRVRLGPTTQEAVEAIMAEASCTPQEALDIMTERQRGPSSMALSGDDKAWFLIQMGQFHEDNLADNKVANKALEQRLFAVENSLNLMRLLIAAIVERDGSDENKEVMRQVTASLDNIIRPLEKDPAKILEEAIEMERQQKLLSDGQFVRQQEGGDGKELDELEPGEPERER